MAMDTEIKNAYDIAKYQKVFQNQRNLLKQRIMTFLQIGHNGGIFQIDPQLIQLVKFLLDDGRTLHPILDLNENPIMIEDLEGFYAKITGRYSEALNEYYSDYEKLKQARDTKAVVDV